MMSSSNLPHISSISFGDDGVEIVYAEPRDVDGLKETGVLQTRIVMCRASLVEAELTELLEDAATLLDAILIIARNPTAGTFGR